MSFDRQTWVTVAGIVALVLLCYTLALPWERDAFYQRAPLFVPPPDDFQLAIPRMLWEAGVIAIVSAAIAYVFLRTR